MAKKKCSEQVTNRFTDDGIYYKIRPCGKPAIHKVQMYEYCIYLCDEHIEAWIKGMNKIWKCPGCDSTNLQTRFDGHFICRECSGAFYAPDLFDYWRKKDLPQFEVIEETKKITRSDFTPTQRWKIMERDGFKCVKCGRTVADGIKLHVDHIYPKKHGGRATLENGQTLCDECNIGKGARVPKQLVSGLGS